MWGVLSKLTIFVGIFSSFFISILIDTYTYFNNKFDIYLMGSHFFTVILMSILIFYYFTITEFNENRLISLIASHSFLIYLSHPIFLHLFRTIALRYTGSSLLVVIPMLTILTFIFSLIFSYIYNFIANIICKCMKSRANEKCKAIYYECSICVISAINLLYKTILII